MHPYLFELIGTAFLILLGKPMKSFFSFKILYGMKFMLFGIWELIFFSFSIVIHY